MDNLGLMGPGILIGPPLTAQDCVRALLKIKDALQALGRVIPQTGGPFNGTAIFSGPSAAAHLLTCCLSCCL